MAPRDDRVRTAVVLWRTGHGLITAGFLAAIAYIWLCALTGRRDRMLAAVIGALAAEGTLVALNHGDCPLGPLGDRIGDQVPLFELVLEPRAAKRAVPVLGGVAAAGVALLALRSRSGIYRRVTGG